MFEFILPLYTTDVRAIRIDFLGNGKSERVSRFPDELWIDQGHEIVELCKKLNCGKINLVGTSGGAYAAINAALEMPDLFHKVVADSFDGNILPEGFANAVIQERQFAKKEEQARGFYEWCQGEDWEFVVDLDTECRHLHDLNRNNSYKIYETGSHPLIVSRAEEIAQLIKDFLMK